MKKYRRLDHKHAKKLNEYKKLRKRISYLFKWLTVSSFMVMLIGGCIISFYFFIDSKEKNDISGKANDYVDSINSRFSQEESYDENCKLEGEINKCQADSNESIGENDFKEMKKYDFSDWNKTCKKEMLVVNKDNPIPEDFNVKTKVCRGKEVGSIIYENLNKMIEDAKKDGIILWISSGYRSVGLQEKLFNRQIEREKNKGISHEKAVINAQSVVAKPGTSEHNTGMAIDFNGVEDGFYKTKEYEWLMQHACEYGFILRYPQDKQKITGVIYEPWHFRYVGVENAKEIKESGLCLEEYMWKAIMNKN